MSFTELPTKLVETASTSSVEKMKVSCELLKISYDKKIAAEEVLKNYTIIFNGLNAFDTQNEITPQQKTLGFIHRNYKIIYFLFISIIIFLLFLFFQKNVN
jgi:hypothetical protein